jgi:hypothetical protein
LFPAVLDEYIGDDNPARAIDVFVEGLEPHVGAIHKWHWFCKVEMTPGGWVGRGGDDCRVGTVLELRRSAKTVVCVAWRSNLPGDGDPSSP